MQISYARIKARVAMLAIASLLASPLAPLVPVSAQTPTAAAVTAPQPDGGWPRFYTTASGAALVVYQPQIASWPEQKKITAYAAVSYTSKGAQQPALGTIKVESDSSVALDERLVSFSDLTIVESSFPTLQRDQLRTVVSEITTSMPLDDRVIGLDRVMANLDTSLIIPRNVDGVKADPPTIFFSQTPAILVNLDGDPIWTPIKENDLQSAVNTNWDLFLHGPTSTYYLRDDKEWLKATDIKGPWTSTVDLPDSFKKLPDDGNWTAVKENLPGWRARTHPAPKVFVTMTPAEMILLNGPPVYATIQGANQLRWVSNTNSDVFRMGQTGLVYFLVSGRWFSSPGFMGPWTFATPTLPPDFKNIPPEHPRSRVLASVPGTTQAAEAVLLTEIPQTARVSKTTPAPPVAYQGGPPEFQPIPTTTVQRAVNTDKDVLKVGDLYYLCFQGVWFMSTMATGPWQVTGDVPKVIYTIPVNSPAYPVTYVTVQQSSNDAVVFATAMAFTGVMVAWGCAVWGTGYYYPPYVWRGAYPVYYPHYPTYGYGAAYNPWTGAYTRGAVAYGPYGGAGAAQRYNPSTGLYSRGAVAYGPYGASGAAQAYNPRTGAYGQTRQSSNIYGSWGSTQVQRGDQWASTSRYTSNVTGATTRTTQTSQGGVAASRTGPGGNTAAIGRTGSGDVYAGADGNVYKKQGGSWQQYGGNGSWSNAQPTQAQRQQAQSRAASAGWDSATAGQVQRDSASRAEGAQRTSDLSSWRSSASSRFGGGGGGFGSYRFGGGGRRR